jgi:uncharacterized protein YutE (UPF0331/DUF86 family)
MSPTSTRIARSLLRALREYVTDLEPIRDIGVDALRADKIRRRFAERTLQIAAECCLDLAFHLISIEGWREATGNRDAIRVIEEQGVIGADLATKLNGNILVHGYAKVDPAVMAAILANDLDDLHAYGAAIRAWVDAAEAE